MFGGLKIPEFLPQQQQQQRHEERRTIQHEGNEYTDNLLRALGLTHIWTIPYKTATNLTTTSLEKGQLVDFVDGNSLVIDDLDDITDH